jgi:cell division protein FtsB
MRLAVDKLEESLAAQRQELEELRRELAALRTDHRAIERVAREKFGLCREDEQIYHFDAAPAPAREPLKRAGSQPAPEGAPPANP